MTSVYLSSTYADLEKHRRAVYETLRTIGVDVRDTLEHAVARHERSLEACRQDVQRCDVYVGLFAFRYGFVPEQDNADQQSITELEYRHALENGKPCLIFLADPKGWPLGQTDSYSGDNDSGARIKALRDALTRGHTPRPFDSPTDLANKVQAALRPYLSAEGAGRERCWPEDESPYPGLDYYTEHYAPVYFGREPQVREVLDRLAEPGGDFVLVSGASGSGKSSLVGAGVIPALKAGALDGSRAWEVVRFVPGQDKDPFRSLAMYLFQRLESRVDKLAARWAAQPESLRADLLRLLASGQDGARGLLFMDQMEELFTATEARHHAPFIDALVGAAGDPVRVIATVRSEFLGECEGHDPLHRLLEAGRHVALWRVGEAALLDMIRRPAQCAGLALDPDLPERLLEGTGREPGNLALLAYALKKLYDLGAAERRLRLSDYEAFGGVQGVVGHIAESAFAGFVKDLGEAEGTDPQAARVAAEAALFRVFRELVTVSAEGVPTRRRAAKARFEGDAAARALVQRFSDEETRLLVTDRDRNRATLEVAHEALFTSWETLDRWIAARRDAERLLAQAKLAGREWRESGYAQPPPARGLDPGGPARPGGAGAPGQGAGRQRPHPPLSPGPPASRAGAGRNAPHPPRRDWRPAQHPGRPSPGRGPEARRPAGHRLGACAGGQGRAGGRQGQLRGQGLPDSPLPRHLDPVPGLRRGPPRLRQPGVVARPRTRNAAGCAVPPLRQRAGGHGVLVRRYGLLPLADGAPAPGRRALPGQRGAAAHRVGVAAGGHRREPSQPLSLGSRLG
jgi:hypothetical protein